MSTAAERLAALKARVAAAVSGAPEGNTDHGGGSSSRGGGAGGSGGFSSRGSFNRSIPTERNSGMPPSGGLNVPLHPALENLGASTFTSKPTGRGKSFNQRGGRRGGAGTAEAAAVKTNPYLDDSPTVSGQGAVATAKARVPRKLHFNEKGKYIQEGNALRRQAALEEMKRRIAEQARKAGIDEIPSDKNFVVEEPPALEWVDEAYFVAGKTYADLGSEGCLVELGDESIVTDLVQHPTQLQPAQDKLVPAPKPMYLTKKEQKKERRTRRMAELKERQAKIRLGLMPAPPPKVKRSNLMRVLGEEAVQDPTAVEARVNREIAERFQTHMAANEERKLTREQRLAKLAANQEKDAAKGIHMLIFQIPSLVNGQHRFKIWKNAEQLALTGVCIMHPKTNLVVVEGGEHSIGKYRKLMMHRIDWTQNTPAPPPPPSTADDDKAKNKAGPARDWLASESESLPSNQIRLLFDGETKTRAFWKWSSRVCDTDREAYEFLSRLKLESFWTQARSGT